MLILKDTYVSPKSHAWSPIEDLPHDWEALGDDSVTNQVQMFRDQEGELRQRGAYETFLAQLRRQFAVETGAIEEVYRISEGATKTLIERGLDAALISHTDTDEPAAVVVEKIRDQHAAIEGVYQFVSSQRGLSKSYVRQLHQVITEHQRTYDARDTLGQQVTRPLPRGCWKTWPNNVEGPDGCRFEFCPPEQVEGEIDRLFAMHEHHGKDGVCPLVQCAWFHHRFTLIHPFTDGNGRMARLLASAILIRARWLPLVVLRADKLDYIRALRSADTGDLKPLVDLFGALQKRVVRQALSIGESALQHTSKIQAVLQTVKLQLERRNDERGALMDRATDVAKALQYAALKRFEELAGSIAEAVRVGQDYRAYALGAGPDDERAPYYRHQIVQCARQLGYYANLGAFRTWAVLVIQTDVRTEVLLSIHRLGHGLSGAFACACMVYSKRPTEDQQAEIGEVTPLSGEPFEFTYAEPPGNVQKRFDRWLDECLGRGLKYWQDEIV